MKRILVTGGAGYIGSHTSLLLKEKGYDVVVVDNLEKGHKESLNGIKLEIGNLNDEKFLEGIFSSYKIDGVVHFAGYIEVGESMRDPLKYFKNNVCNGINLIKMMIKYGVDKIVFSSSAAVYGSPKEIPIKEDSEKRPTSYYGLSKLMFENILDACTVYGIKNICLRYFNAAGAGFGIGEDHNPETHLIPLVLKTALGQRESIKIFGDDYPTKDGTCIRDYIHVVDLAGAHLLALKALENGVTGKYNVGTGKGYSVKEIIEIAKEVTGKDIKVEISKRREGDPPILIADPTKIMKELGWKPKFGIRDIIKSAWEWHKNNPYGFRKS